jgi:hypothetical protein
MGVVMFFSDQYMSVKCHDTFTDIGWRAQVGNLMQNEAGNFVSGFPQARWNRVLHRQDDIENSYWPSLLHPFITLKVSRDFAPRIAPASGFVGERQKCFPPCRLRHSHRDLSRKPSGSLLPSGSRRRLSHHCRVKAFLTGKEKGQVV